MRRCALLVAVVLMAGCRGNQADGPKTATDEYPRLTKGASAMIVGTSDANTIGPTSGRDRPLNPDMRFLKVGTAVEVEWDESTEEEFPGHRFVRALVLDGEHKGFIGYIERYKLRPTPK